jgi:hypothetical protein
MANHQLLYVVLAVTTFSLQIKIHVEGFTTPFPNVNVQHEISCVQGISARNKGWVNGKLAFIGNLNSRQSVVNYLTSSDEEYEESDEDDDEWEYEYEEEEEEYEYEEEEEQEEIDDEDKEQKEVESKLSIPLQDDPDDPLYMEQKRIIETAVAESSTLNEAKEMMATSDTSTEFLEKSFVDFLDIQLDKAGIEMAQVEEAMKDFEISEKDAEEAIAEDIENKKDMTATDRKGDFLRNLGSGPDAFPPDGDTIYQTGEGGEKMSIKNKDLVRLQNALEGLVGTTEGFTDGSSVNNKQAMIRPTHELQQLDHQTLDEINLCVNASAVNANGHEYGETIKNEDPYRWLLYDLDFNVTNLLLASCKHNPSAPLLLNHWMPQLCAYSRYADVRERDFEFTHDDCENADTNELLKYFQGLGYDEIPTFTPKETNIVQVDTEYDQEDITMSAFENWMDEVYTDENEDLYFDDEDFQPEHNVFDFDFGLEDSDNVRGFKAEFEEFNREHNNETQAWRERYAKESKYELVNDSEGAEAFRGHLVVACSGSDHDLELAEKITLRMDEEFGKQVYVETRVYNHARQEDNVYEIWIESYDIQLIHSRRGAFYNANQWDGPADVDDKQLECIVDRVRILISDDARYSYHIHEFFTEV